MNRTLRRPMFRTGGTAEGITSGLSRQGYAGVDKEIAEKKWQYNKRNLEAKYGTFENYLSALKQINTQKVIPSNQGTSSSSDWRDLKIGDLSEKTFGEIWDKAKAVGYKPKTNAWDYMGELALNLVSKPSSGDLLADIALSSKDPYSRYLERKQSADEQRYGSEADIFKTMLGGAFSVASAKEKGKAEGKGWLKQWEFEQIPILNRTIRDLTEKQDKGIITREEELELKNAIDQRSRIVDLDEVTKGFLNSEEGGELVVDEMAILLEKDLQIEDPTKRKYPKGKKDVQLYLDAIAEVKRRLGMAKGGRVGYQSGNMVQPNAMQASMPMDQGEQVPEELQNIDYDTLRARLPQSITDDIVRLISTSAEAMEDFATIQSQQDINNFNQKYGVELVLPAEA
jgi:hypothetical protein